MNKKTGLKKYVKWIPIILFVFIIYLLGIKGIIGLILGFLIGSVIGTIHHKTIKGFGYDNRKS